MPQSCRFSETFVPAECACRTFFQFQEKQHNGSFTDRKGSERSVARRCLCSRGLQPPAGESEIGDTQSKTQQILAARFRPPQIRALSLTLDFALSEFKPRGDCFGDLLAQIEVASHTFGIPATRRQHRPGMMKTDFVSQLASFLESIGTEIRETDAEGFQARKFLGESESVAP